MKGSYHQPVMVGECLEGLNIRPDGIYVDATFGGGGHARAILSSLGNGRLFAFDQDRDAISNLADDPRLTFVHQNFSQIAPYLKLHKASLIDGLLADLGISSHQIDTPDRGFSTRFEGPLDMRMNQQAALTAESVVNTYETARLAEIFIQYGELPNARALAGGIATRREASRIKTTGELVAIAETFVRGQREKYLARVFQALRIEVNRELEMLRELLLQSAELLRQGGRLVILTYHSLEDRLVKNFVRRGGFTDRVETDEFGNPRRLFREINRKPIRPSAGETRRNPRARSAKLRIAERL